jgi:hypothetical protein
MTSSESTPSITPIEERMLSLLQRLGSTTAAYLGSELWGRSADIRCENIRATAWARPAGAVLHRLLEKGLVRCSYVRPRWLWDRTDRSRQ